MEEVRKMRSLSRAMRIVGFLLLLLGASAADYGPPDEPWALLVTAGMVLLALGAVLRQYSIYLRRERSKRSRRYKMKKSA